MAILGRSALGLDLGSHQIKAVELRHTLRGIEVGASSAPEFFDTLVSGSPVALRVDDLAALEAPVRSWVEQSYTDIRHWTEHDKGGHFAAFEVSDTFVADLREFFRLIR